MCGKLKRVLASGLAAGAVILVIWWAVSTTVMSALPYDIASMPGMRATDDPMMGLWLLFPWVISFPMAIVFEKLKGGFGHTGMQRAKCFGLMVWLLYGLPSIFVVYTSMDYPIGFNLAMLLSGIFYIFAAAVVIEKLNG